MRQCKTDWVRKCQKRAATCDVCRVANQQTENGCQEDWI